MNTRQPAIRKNAYQKSAIQNNAYQAVSNTE